MSGSPPRSRGPRGHHPARAGREGLTPAFAGTTERDPGRDPRRPAHPRVRGDHALPFMNCPGGVGSPPRSRGPRELRRKWQVGKRLTPAFAGTTTRTPRRFRRSAAHPRVRGDHPPSGLYRFGDAGSPPRSRGPRGSYAADLPAQRLTPAFAGTTVPGAPRGPRAPAHPRVRGDHCRRSGGCCPSAGSPPRSRGPRRLRQLEVGGHGLTPAFAGTTSQLRPVSRGPRAHPRVRGDHVEVAVVADEYGGSPPRSRGPLPAGTHPGRRPGLTPAFAGTTSGVPAVECRSEAHPRVRGDHFLGLAHPRLHGGSPPRSRGPPLVLRPGRRRLGLTPAFAGTTTPWCASM